MKTNNKGFSLVELIVVIAIMAILAAVAIPTFASFITKANEAADEDFANGVKYAVNLALTADGEEAKSVAIEWDASTKAISKLSYVVTEGETDVTYVVIGEKTGTEKDATATIKADITATIDLEYDMKTDGSSINEKVDGVTVTAKSGS